MLALFDRPHDEARALCATGQPIYLEVNPVEYHGPHLPLRNDSLVSRGLALDLHARLREAHPGWGDIIIASGIEVGIDVVPGPGAREASYSALRELVLDACRSLADLGARRVVLMSFHGGPLHGLAVHEGVRLLERRGVQAFAPLNLVTHEMLALDATRYRGAFEGIEDAATRETLERELATDFHAGFFETSMTLHYAPASVSPGHRTLPPCPPIRQDRALLAAAAFAGKLGRSALERELRYAAHGRGWYSLDPFPGYTGRPALASPAAGAFFARAIVDRYLARALEVFEGKARSPEPILRWLGAATLGGRVGRVPRVEPAKL